MTSRTIGRRIAAVTCGAVLLLAGCGAADDAADTGEGTSASSTSARAGTPSSAPGEADTAAPAPDTPEAPQGPAQPDAPAPGGPAASAPEEPAPAATPADTPAGGAWDPCTLPQADLISAGLDVSSAEPITLTSFPACKWLSADQTFDLVVSTSDQSMDALLDPTLVEDVRRSSFYGREFAQYRSLADSNKIGCHIGTAAGSGSIVITARNLQRNTDAGDPCLDVNKVATAIFNSLP
ncbi:MAG TPA: DUF3558 family protein [Nocardia sp.]|uniref:DUF3558 family protein n=1 Tax=Nocardia TaxID=1817 RepID=UPI0024562D72|nr:MULTISPECIES: DUF3558 family protein [Nocardia]HLS78983.1 DUF3558 family protein [Nocardia sp.]